MSTTLTPPTTTVSTTTKLTTASTITTKQTTTTTTTTTTVTTKSSTSTTDATTTPTKAPTTETTTVPTTTTSPTTKSTTPSFTFSTTTQTATEPVTTPTSTTTTPTTTTTITTTTEKPRRFGRRRPKRPFLNSTQKPRRRVTLRTNSFIPRSRSTESPIDASEEFIEDAGESADPDQETEAVTSSPEAEQENEIEQNPRFRPRVLRTRKTTPKPALKISEKERRVLLKKLFGTRRTRTQV